MANFYINDTTTAGESLLADVIGKGGIFTPTRIVVGSGSMPSGKAAKDMTTLVKQEAQFPINKKKRMADQSNALIGGAFSNKDVTQGFTLKEIGIYAKAVYADGTESSEVLYSYGNAGDQGDYIPAYSTSTVVERQIDITAYIGAEATVNLTVESQVYISTDTFDAANQGIENSINTINTDMTEIRRLIGNIDSILDAINGVVV
ncbi:MAG: phage tail protein [Clostridiales Family XIII bacterium]|uniref:Phage tail protein n=1 Tax=Hominibacterium faecale TaxID=2839743 RepID=A0A9J6QTL7_9FIRM|nr:phage tail protein [Hominibacterium faecale]MCU7378115.1 phage tail protein [Hominibacterium faecale]MDY3011424.1 phage tail protein [Clostridiales Family XIII bacterium]